MKKTISLKKAIIFAVLLSVLVGSAVAAVLMTRTINNTFRVLGAANFKLVRSDDNLVEVTSIDWGDFSPLEGKDSLTVLGYKICILNTGNVGLEFAWNATGLERSQWSITAAWGTSNPFPENTWNIFSVAPGNVNGFMVFTLTSLDPYAPAQSGSFTIAVAARAT